MSTNLSRPRMPLVRGLVLACIAVGLPACALGFGPGNLIRLPDYPGVDTRFSEGRIRALSPDGSIALFAVASPDEIEGDLQVPTGKKAVPFPTPYPEVARSSTRTEHRLVDAATGTVLERDVQLGEVVEVRSRRVFALLDRRFVLHEGLPPRGWKQRMPDGVVGPGAQYPIRLTDSATTRSALLLPQTLNWPISYGPFEFVDGAR